jgi:hypothetical protein
MVSLNIPASFSYAGITKPDKLHRLHVESGMPLGEISTCSMVTLVVAEMLRQHIPRVPRPSLHYMFLRYIRYPQIIHHLQKCKKKQMHSQYSNAKAIPARKQSMPTHVYHW